MNKPSGSVEQFVSLNALLFFILPVVGTIAVTSGAIGFFAADKGWMLPFGLWSIVSGLVYLSFGQRPSIDASRRRWIWATISCLVLILGLTVRQIAIRPGGERPNGIYDGAVQSEVAADFLLHGKNPYGADYRGTPYQALNMVPSSGVDTDNNPVWYHYIYPPLTFLVYVPISLLHHVLGFLADYRVISVGALLVLSWLIIRRAKDWPTRTTLTMLTLGNPLLWLYAVIGCNETVVALTVIGSILLLMKRRWLWSGILFGAAIASKQIVWLLVPLWVYWLWRQYRAGDLAAAQARRVLLGAVLSIVVLVGPFILWNPSAVWNDLIVFATGSVPNTYPLAGTTFLQYLHVFRIVESPWSPVPVYLFQLMVGIPMFVLTAGWIRAKHSPSRWLAGATTILISLFLVGRYFNNNFFITPMAFLVLAYALEAAQPDESLITEHA